MEWVKVAITEQSHMAYLDPEEEWNGFARPWFTMEEALKMNEWLNDLGSNLAYDEDGDFFYETDDGYEYRYYGEDIDGYHLYPVGSGSWVWLIEDDEE